MLLVFPFIHHLQEICSIYKTSGVVPMQRSDKGNVTGELFDVDKSSSLSQPAKCCSRTFKRKYAFLKHAKTLKHQKNTLCWVCRQQFRTTGDLYQHKRLVHGFAELMCEVCSTSFIDQHQLENHIQHSHKQPTHFCNLCPFKAKSLNLLRNHQNISHSLNGTQESRSSNQEGPFECCGKFFMYLSHYERHKMTLLHFGQRRCGICHEAFDSAEALEKHRKDLHFFNGSRWACPICKLTFSSNGGLSTHIREIHIKTTTFDCDKCSYVAASKFGLTRHIASRHLPDQAARKYSCDICTRRFRRRDTLTSHKQTHNAIGAYKCSDCTYSAHSKNALTQHFIGKHGSEPKQYKCTICSRQYHTEAQYKKHANLHKKHGLFYQYCNKCKFSCNSLERMEAHKITHRPCQVCGVVVQGGARCKEKHLKSHLTLCQK